MRLTKEAIEEFQKLYEEEFGEQLSFEEAEIRGSEIVELYQMLAEPLPGERDDPLPRAGANAPVDNLNDPPRQESPHRTSPPTS